LFKFRSACPRIASGDADHLSRIVADHKAQAPTIMASGCMTIVLVEAFFYRVDVIQREVVPWLYLKGHSEHPS